MTVSELIKLLQECDQNALVVVSADSEGNHFSHLDEISTGRYNSDNEFGLAELTEELEDLGYSEEDVVDGPKAVCIWPKGCLYLA